MERIDGPDTVGVLPVPSATGTPGFFRPANPGAGQEATIVSLDWANGIQEELVSIIADAGIARDKSDLGQVLAAIKVIIATNAPQPKGLLRAHFEYQSATQVRLSRGLERNVWIEIDGLILKTANDNDQLFDMATDLVGSENASTWYYAYLENVAGTLTPHIDSNAPVVGPGAGKIGYHPSNPTWRFVGAFFNDASSNILPFDGDSLGGALLRQIPSTFEIDLGTTAPTSYQLVDISALVPDGVRYARCQVRKSMANYSVYYGHESLNGQDAATVKAPFRTGQIGNASGSLIIDSIGFWLPVDASPSMAWAMVYAGAGTAFTREHDLAVVGWRY